MLRGEKGIVIELTDGTLEANKEFLQNAGFYDDLLKTNVEGIVKPSCSILKAKPILG